MARHRQQDRFAARTDRDGNIDVGSVGEVADGAGLRFVKSVKLGLQEPGIANAERVASGPTSCSLSLGASGTLTLVDATDGKLGSDTQTCQLQAGPV